MSASERRVAFVTGSTSGTGIDILVNNAGFNFVHPVESYPVATWHKMMAVHLTAPFLLSKFFVPYMKKKGWGRIVNTSSLMGLISAPGKAPYTVTKSSLIAFAKGLALEIAKHGITCNAICPGFVETD
ncbi:D-beta-hydroxybutyrate dehydrogenase-like [Dreissena polymorpha]|uniref:D-beta-hydroxybutyrate dehydrogenase-like n=1 Tax=Dreissena polymorpha TaxID=45954 RepID=UPI002264F340|nr:D-beta-hydroxybutyrate dehydrogenase-like [Dreissena polymorpha]